jgi:hypothetical protein
LVITTFDDMDFGERHGTASFDDVFNAASLGDKLPFKARKKRATR